MKLILAAFFSVAVSASSALADLKSDVDAVLRDKFLAKSTVSVEVLELGKDMASSHVLYKNGSDKPLIPASNLKLATTAAALAKLGADFNFDTRLVAHDGDLIIIGDGDPTLGDVELVGKYGWKTTTVFDVWAKAVKDRKIDSVKDVIVDDSVFEEKFVHPNWPTDQLNLRYVAGVAGLNLNANCIDFYFRPTARGTLIDYIADPPTKYAAINNRAITDDEPRVNLTFDAPTKTINIKGKYPGSKEPVAIPVDDPSLFTATVLSEALQRAGVKVTGTVKRDRSVRATLASGGKGYTVLAHHTSPIGPALDRANTDSMNLYAESLCKRLGFAETGQPGSWQNGPTAVAKYLGSIGVSASEFSLDDGCGLSKSNTISANALATVLQKMYFAPSRDLYLNSLATPGKGTLEKRFREIKLSGNIYAKSGFVNGVSAFSGYLQSENGKWHVFSIIMNNIPRGENSTAKTLQEKIVKAIDIAGE